MDESIRKAQPCRGKEKGENGARGGIDRLGIILGDPADRGPPQEMKEKVAWSAPRN